MANPEHSENGESPNVLKVDISPVEGDSIRYVAEVYCTSAQNLLREALKRGLRDLMDEKGIELNPHRIGDIDWKEEDFVVSPNWGETREN